LCRLCLVTKQRVGYTLGYLAVITMGWTMTSISYGQYLTPGKYLEKILAGQIETESIVQNVTDTP